MQLILSKVLMIFLYIAVGFLANKLRILGSDSLNHLISLVLNITTPCLLISSICSQNITEDTFSNTVIIILISLILFSLFGFITVRISRLFKNKSKDDQNVLSVAMVTCNSGFMGFPIALSVFGSTVLYYSVIQNVAFNLYLFTGAMVQLALGDNAGRRGEKFNACTLLRPFRNFVTIVSVVSVILLFIGFKIPSYPMNFITDIGNITVPLSMIIVGIQLGNCKFKELFGSMELIISALVCLVFIPAMVLILMWFTPLSNIVRLTIVLSFTYPSAVLGVALAAKERKNVQLMAEAVALSTLLSTTSLPIWIIILSRLFA